MILFGACHGLRLGDAAKLTWENINSERQSIILRQTNQGVAKEIRMKFSGHKSAVHERYTHHELEALRKQIEKVPSFQNKEEPGQKAP
jgi:integrase